MEDGNILRFRPLGLTHEQFRDSMRRALFATGATPSLVDAVLDEVMPVLIDATAEREIELRDVPPDLVPHLLWLGGQLRAAMTANTLPLAAALVKIAVELELYRKGFLGAGAASPASDEPPSPAPPSLEIVPGGPPPSSQE